jgi:hypothetical protein
LAEAGDLDAVNSGDSPRSLWLSTGGSITSRPAERLQFQSCQSTIKKQHLKAIKASGVAPFVPYDLRHTCLTRWARYLDPFALKKLAGHESLETTMKYIHLNEVDSEARLREARKRIESERDEVQGGHTSGHTSAFANKPDGNESDMSNDFRDMWRARPGSNGGPIDSKSIALSN